MSSSELDTGGATVPMSAVTEAEPTERVELERASQTRRITSLVTPAIVIAILAVSFFLNVFRQAEAVDLKSDEATYAIESVSLYRTGMTKWDGAAFLVQPPVFFMIEGAYFKALGVGNGPLFDRLVNTRYNSGKAFLPAAAPAGGETMFDAINASRVLSALYGALAAVILFLLGRALLDWRLGLLTAGLFMLDPYVVWRHHLNYIEPLAALFGVLMYYEYFVALRTPPGRRRTLFFAFAGVFFGLALLTKELGILYGLPLLLYWVFFRRVGWRHTFLVLLTGLDIYMLFPIWAAAHGQFGTWWSTRNWLFNRLIGQIRDTGIARPGSSFTQTLSVNLPDYWPWLLLMALAALLVAVFLSLYLLRRLRDPAAELLASVIIGTYGFFVVVGALGGVINEQFFHFLMPFVVTTVAFAVLAWPRLARALRESRGRHEVGAAGHGNGQGNDGWEGLQSVSGHTAAPARVVGGTRGERRLWLAVLIVTGALLAYNLGAWVARYAFSRDDSYAQVEGKLAQTLPAGSAIAGRDLLDLYLMPRQNVYLFSYFNLLGRPLDPGTVRELGIPYTILNDQSLAEGYGGANPIYYDWVRKNGQQVNMFRGRLYNTYVYHLDYSRPEQPFNANSIAVGRPAVASSVEDPRNLSPANAFDARLGTRWASKETDNEWIYVDLGESRAISKVILSWEAAYAKSYQLQVSDDARNWRTFYTTASGSGGLEEIDGKAQGRYVRLLMSKRSSKYGYSLWEISIYP